MKLNFKLIIKTIVLTCLSLFFLFLILRTFVRYGGQEGMTTDASGTIVETIDVSGNMTDSIDMSGTVLTPLDISGVVAVPSIDSVSPSVSPPIN
jgi:hypothetical protein